MITLTGNGRLTRDVALRTTHSGKTVATISVASDRRDRNAEPVYLDLIVWDAQTKAAGEHLIEGQAISFSGRLEPHQYATSSGDHRVALELHGVDIEYGAKPRRAEPSSDGLAVSDAAEQAEDDIPFSRTRSAGRQPSGPPDQQSRAPDAPGVPVLLPVGQRRSEILFG